MAYIRNDKFIKHFGFFLYLILHNERNFTKFLLPAYIMIFVGNNFIG